MIHFSQRGSFIVFAILTLSTFFLIVGLMMDTAWVYSCRLQLRNAVDALAIIGSKKMITDSIANATTEVLNSAGQFKVGGEPLALLSSDVRFGVYNATTGVFSPTSVTPDSIEVTGRRTTDAPSGPVPLFFMKVFAQNFLNLTMKAYASISTLDLILVTDVSGSMGDDTQCLKWSGGKNPTCQLWGPPEPLTSAKNAAISFLTYLRPNYDRAGFVSFSDTPSLRSPLTYTYSTVQSAINSVSASGYTNIGGAIQTALAQYANNGRQISAKVILLLSDGQPNCTLLSGNCGGTSYYNTQGENYAKAQAQLAAQQHIIIFTISLGSAANRSLMQYLATTTGGKEYFAPTGADLQGIYNQIAKDLPVKLVG